MSLSAFKQVFDPVLLELVQEKAQAAVAMVPDPFIGELVRYGERVIGAGGKRGRPYVAWVACGMPSDRAFLRCLAALEIFHAFALMHDDVMDRGQTRHGVPTLHEESTRRMREAGRHGDLVHIGNAQAILAGDLLFQWANEALYEGAPLFPAPQFERAVAVFRHMVNEVIMGQMLDVDLATRPSVSMGLIQTKMQLKTAGYTFVRPLQFGLALSGQNADAPWVNAFGQAFGVAFQIQDDLLDLQSPATETGKTVFADLCAGQPTFLTQYIIEQGTDAQRTELAQLMGATLTEADRPRIMALFTESGAFAFGDAEIERGLAQAAQAIAQAPEAIRAPLAALVEHARHRAA